MRRSWDLLRKKKQNISDKEVSRQQNLRNGGANFRCPPFLLVSVRCFPPSSPWDSVPHPAKGAFLKKRPLEPPKNFFRCVKAKPDGLWAFRERTLSRLKRRTSLTGFSFPVGRCPTPCQGCVFEKTPLGTLKYFFRFVKAKPDGLWAFRERTLSPPEKACPDGLVRPPFVGRCPTPCQGAFLKKRPLEPSKTFLGS